MRNKLRVPAALVGSLVAGMLVAVQSRINGGLSQELDSGFVAAVVSFGSGLVVMTVILVFSRRARSGFRTLFHEVRAGRFPAWAMLGGLAGASFVLTQGLVATVIGVALFTVGIVAGQVLGGLVFDRIGLGPSGKVDPSLPRLVGTGLVIIGVVVSVSDGFVGGAVWLVLLPLIAGVAMAWQSAVNGLVRSVSQSAITATYVNFVVGTTMLLVIAVVSVAVRGWPAEWPTEPALYIGGLLGIVFIVAATVLVRIIGVLLLSMSNVAGQLIASVLIEAGLPLAGGVSVGMLIGALVALIAVLIAAMPGRSSTAR